MPRARSDRTASLAISRGDNGGTLLHCFAGCLTPNIVREIGMTMRELAPPEHINGKAGPKIVKTYSYVDEAGDLLFQVCRMEPKDFRQRAPKPGGGWNWTTKGVRRVPYRLPELLAADPETVVYVCEGEKDCDRLASLGIVATTNCGGAGKWRDQYSEPLRGRDVVILPDNDERRPETRQAKW